MPHLAATSGEAPRESHDGFGMTERFLLVRLASASTSGSSLLSPKALIVKKHWLDQIAEGRKTWGLRGACTMIRGRIGLIESGSGKVMCTVELTDVVGPLSLSELRRNTGRHRVPWRAFDSGTPYPRTFALGPSRRAPLSPTSILRAPPGRRDLGQSLSSPSSGRNS